MDIQVLGFGFQGLGIRVEGSFRFRVWGVRIEGLGGVGLGSVLLGS